MIEHGKPLPDGFAEKIGKITFTRSMESLKEAVEKGEDLPRNLPLPDVLLGMATELFTCVYAFTESQEFAENLLNRALKRGMKAGDLIKEAREIADLLEEDEDE